MNKDDILNIYIKETLLSGDHYKGLSVVLERFLKSEKNISKNYLAATFQDIFDIINKFLDWMEYSSFDLNRYFGFHNYFEEELEIQFYNVDEETNTLNDIKHILKIKIPKH